MKILYKEKGQITPPTEEEKKHSNAKQSSYDLFWNPDRWDADDVIEERLGLKHGPFRTEDGEYRYGWITTWKQDDGSIKYDYEVYDENPFGGIITPVWECTTYANVGGEDVIVSVEEV